MYIFRDISSLRFHTLESLAHEFHSLISFIFEFVTGFQDKPDDKMSARQHMECLLFWGIATSDGCLMSYIYFVYVFRILTSLAINELDHASNCFCEEHLRNKMTNYVSCSGTFSVPSTLFMAATSCSGWFISFR